MPLLVQRTRRSADRGTKLALFNGVPVRNGKCTCLGRRNTRNLFFIFGDQLIDDIVAVLVIRHQHKFDHSFFIPAIIDPDTGSALARGIFLFEQQVEGILVKGFCFSEIHGIFEPRAFPVKGIDTGPEVRREPHSLSDRDHMRLDAVQVDSIMVFASMAAGKTKKNGNSYCGVHQENERSGSLVVPHNDYFWGFLMKLSAKYYFPVENKPSIIS